MWLALPSPSKKEGNGDCLSVVTAHRTKYFFCKWEQLNQPNNIILYSIQIRTVAVKEQTNPDGRILKGHSVFQETLIVALKTS